jgi:hypothetical protein
MHVYVIIIIKVVRQWRTMALQHIDDEVNDSSIVQAGLVKERKKVVTYTVKEVDAVTVQEHVKAVSCDTSASDENLDAISLTLIVHKKLEHV